MGVNWCPASRVASSPKYQVPSFERKSPKLSSSPKVRNSPPRSWPPGLVGVSPSQRTTPLDGSMTMFQRWVVPSGFVVVGSSSQVGIPSAAKSSGVSVWPVAP